MWELLCDSWRIQWLYCLHIFDKIYSSLDDFFNKKLKEDSLHSRIVFFGMATNDCKCIKCQKEDEHINLDWFLHHRFDSSIKVFFIPGGAQVLINDGRDWKWVSFAINFDFMRTKFKDSSVIQRIYYDAFKCIYEHDNPKDIKESIYQVFEDAQKKLIKKYDTHDSFEIVQTLNINMANLMCSL